MCTYTVYNIPLIMGSMKLGMNGNRSMGLLLFDFVSGRMSHECVHLCKTKKNHINQFFTTNNKYNLLENMTQLNNQLLSWRGLCRAHLPLINKLENKLSIDSHVINQWITGTIAPTF